MSNILRSKKFHSALGWTISIGLLIWISIQVEWAVVGRELKHIRAWYLVPVTIVFYLHHYFRALRWRYLLPPRDTPTLTLFEALMIGNMATLVLPLRAGEFIRPYILSKDSQYTFATAFSSIVIERFFDLTVVLLLLAGISPLLPTLPNWVIAGAGLLGVLACGIFILMVAGAFIPQLIMRLAAVCLKPVPITPREKILLFISSLLEGASVLRSFYRLGMTLFLSVIVWSSCIWIYHLGLNMFEGEWTWLMSTTLIVVVALAVAAPSAPGFIGILQTACVASLALFGVPKETAFAFSLIIHAHQFVFVSLYGLFVLSRRHLTLRSLNAHPRS